MRRVAILLASYDGARFLDAQLWSIRRQSFCDWHLIVRNDGPDSASEGIVRSHMKEDSRIEWVERNHHRPGPCRNFEYLLTIAVERGFSYFALADQDDVWVDRKLELMLQILTNAELHDTSAPIAIHSDLTIVDETLHPLASSFMHYRGLDPNPAFASLLARNCVTGCTMLGNASLLELALPFPECVIAHDWWLALCAQAVGRLVYLDRATVLYRQHRSNVIGARLTASNALQALHRSRVAFQASFAQAAALTARLRPDSKCQSVLQRYQSLPNKSRPERVREMIRLGIRHGCGISRMTYAMQLLFAKSIAETELQNGTPDG